MSKSNEPAGASTTTELAYKRTDLAADRTRWAADRTLWAADRTFIAWLRTAISMIGFGVGMGKAGDVLEGYGYEIDDYHSLQFVGVAFITLAVFGLVGALVQDFRIGERLNKAGFGRVEPTPLGRVMGSLVLLVGIIGAVVIFL
jgi:putative membrane protein